MACQIKALVGVEFSPSQAPSLLAGGDHCSAGTQCSRFFTKYYCWDNGIQLFSSVLAPLAFMITWAESATGGYSNGFVCILHTTYMG